ncbi:MAG: hypothetical protein IPL74_15345 [Bacteroidetes bacterium]|nr:hypothetical protein [Bacteroidota bacterium]
MNKFLKLMEKLTIIIFYILLSLLAGNQAVAQTIHDIKKSPQTILLTNRPAPVTIQIPTKAGGYFIKDYGEGITRKINLMPPISDPLPIVRKNANGEALSNKFWLAKVFYKLYN